MNNQDDIVREDLARTPNPTGKNRAVRGIKVTVEISFDGINNGNQIEVTFAPNIETLLPQAEKLFIQISILTRGLMLQKLADDFTESGLSGVLSKSMPKPIQAYASIIVGGASVADINGNEVDFYPRAVAETEMFEYEKLEEAKTRLVMSLLRGFAELGGR